MAYVSANQGHDSIVLKVNAERLDATIATDLKSEMLASVKSASSNRVVVDLGSVTFMDSSGLGALVSVRKNIPKDHSMELQHTTEFVTKVLQLTKMDRVFSV